MPNVEVFPEELLLGQRDSLQRLKMVGKRERSFSLMLMSAALNMSVLRMLDLSDNYIGCYCDFYNLLDQVPSSLTVNGTCNLPMEAWGKSVAEARISWSSPDCPRPTVAHRLNVGRSTEGNSDDAADRGTGREATQIHMYSASSTPRPNRLEVTSEDDSIMPQSTSGNASTSSPPRLPEITSLSSEPETSTIATTPSQPSAVETVSASAQSEALENVSVSSQLEALRNASGSSQSETSGNTSVALQPEVIGNVSVISDSSGTSLAESSVRTSVTTQPGQSGDGSSPPSSLTSLPTNTPGVSVSESLEIAAASSVRGLPDRVPASTTTAEPPLTTANSSWMSGVWTAFTNFLTGNGQANEADDQSLTESTSTTADETLSQASKSTMLPSSTRRSGQYSTRVRTAPRSRATRPTTTTVAATTRRGPTRITSTTLVSDVDNDVEQLADVSTAEGSTRSVENAAEVEGAKARPDVGEFEHSPSVHVQPRKAGRSAGHRAIIPIVVGALITAGCVAAGVLIAMKMRGVLLRQSYHTENPLA